MRKAVTLLAGTLLVSQVWAQTKQISGTVRDDKGNPVQGASVQVKGTRTGAVTDGSGNFSLTVPSGGRTLVISSLNFGTVEQSIGSNATFSVVLNPSTATTMDEVVVVGYGTQRRRDVTASIASIAGGSIKDVPVQSFEQALSGKAAGLNVTIPNGVLNNPPVVRIRGINSIQGSSFPLVVIDGVAVWTGDLSTNLAANNPLGNVNPSDIESIEVLKDAAATAIYGSRAANGVLLITTKKGKAGKAKVTYDAWFGQTRPFRLFEVLNARQYVEIKNEAARNLNAPIPGTGQPAGSPIMFLDTINGQIVDTKWSDYLYQNGFQHNHTLSISGANESGGRYYMSANFTDQDGMIRTNSFERKQLRANVDQRVSKWLKLGTNINFSRGTSMAPNSGSLPGTPFSTAGLARLAFVTAPNVSPYAADGRYNIIGIDNPAQRNSFNQIGRNRNLDRSGFYNPVLVRDLNIISSQSDQVLGDVNAELKLAKGLTFRSQYGVNYQIVDDKTFYNSIHGDGLQTVATTDDGLASNGIGKYNITNLQGYLTYDASFGGKHNLNLLAGTEEQRVRIDRWSAQRSGLSDVFYNEFQGNFTINDNPPSNFLSENTLHSFFGRVNYNFRNRYYISGNVRRDGYSAFSANNKWGTFGGGGIGWNLSDENFWGGTIKNYISTLRLRASYGTVGNVSAVGNFASLSTFGSGQYGLGYPTLFFNQAGNSDLRWESSTKLDVGLSYGLFGDKVTGELTYYRSKLEDLIINVPRPPSQGIPGNTVQANAASMYNEGIEFSVSSKVLNRKNFSWTTTLNITTQRNEVTALAEGVPEILGVTQLERTNITKVGEPIGALFGVRSRGVDPATGRRIFLNAAGREVFFNFADPVASRWRFADGSIAPPIDLGRDGVILGTPLPKVYGGFINTFSMYGFDLTLDAIYSYGNKVYFGSRAGLLDQRFWNNSTMVLNRWQKAGDVTDIPRVVYNDNISNGSSFPISENFFNGGFFRMRNITLGYNLPGNIAQRATLSSIRLYASVFNAFTVTKYPGIDPETSVNGNSALTPAVDRNSVGQARTFTFGITVGL